MNQQEAKKSTTKTQEEEAYTTKMKMIIKIKYGIKKKEMKTKNKK